MAMTLLADNTADTTDLATVDFTSSIDSTYKLYIFKFIDINPATDNTDLTFQVNASGQSGYNETVTSTFFFATHSEAGADPAVTIEESKDQGQGTAFQPLSFNTGNGSDESCAGELVLFNPSDTTYVKQWYSRVQNLRGNNVCMDCFAAGYFNFTAALTNVQFKMSSGNLDGTIKMYGVA